MPNPHTPDPRETVARGYDVLVDEFASWGSRVSDPARERLLDAFLARLAAGARILDVGCGAGTVWAGSAATRFAVTGIDLSAGQVEAARRAVPSARFLVADVMRVQFEPQSFDGVLALYSIGHLPPDEHIPAFERIRQWLRPGGLLLAALPAEIDPGTTERWLGGVDMYFASLGASRYRQLLREQGWHQVEVRTDVVDEPEGKVSFLWILATSPELTDR